ncbi:16141_t:CDS:1 [Acaulospora morrowiae]|uniref:16141_t:CDS:1 n=1 Tax=Acaulospora morrowiae TaxID=94023 RepID=A0A9N8YSH0_9GLOM|nr:16141_t:CDS:1 [Acaulospora morrowiae]
MDLEKLNLEASSGVKLEIQSNFNKTSVKTNEIESIGESKFSAHLRSKDNTYSVNAIEPFLPLFASVRETADNLAKIYKDAKHNRQVCADLVNRVKIVEQDVRYLQCHKQENEKYFSSQQYYDAWVGFCHVLDGVKEFAKNVTQLSGLQKYANAKVVRKNFYSVVGEFEYKYGDIKEFYSDEKREQEI